MFETLAQMAVLLLFGLAWRIRPPHGLDADHSRAVLTALVYYFLLPAMVLEVLWRTPLNLNSLRISLVAVSGVLITLPVMWGVYRGILRQPGMVVGALVLAAVFPNVTYLGLPVLEATFGPWARSVAIQYDLFACLPLLFTLGVVFAKAHGTDGKPENVFLTLLKVPSLWAALVGALLGAAHTTPPPWLENWLKLLGQPVVPLMLISLGMSLRLETLSWQKFWLISPALLMQLLLLPYLILHLAMGVGLQDEWRTATILEAAMPSMVLGIVLCDRYHLDSSLYAATVTISTLLSLLTLPAWYGWLGGPG